MKCPNCENTELHLSNRSGVEIDYCPQCRGVWLDRGELDKLIERAQTAAPQVVAARAPAPHQYAPPQQQQRGYDDRFGHGREYKDHSDYRSRKKKGFLGE